MDYIGAWDGSHWSTLGDGIYSTFGWPRVSGVRTVLAIEGTLYVGGVFNIAGSATCNCAAKWQDGIWTAIGQSDTSAYRVVEIDSLAWLDGNLYAGGVFRESVDQDCSELYNLARYDGASDKWVPVGATACQGTCPNCYTQAVGPILALTTHGGSLYIAGYHVIVDGSSPIATWTPGSGYSSLLPEGDGTAVAIAFYDDGDGEKLYVAGDGLINDRQSSGPYFSVARYDNDELTSINGPDINGDVFALCVGIDEESPNGASLYAGGKFESVGSQITNFHNVAKFNANGWASLGNGIVSGQGAHVLVHALQTFDDSGSDTTPLYAFGWFDLVGGEADDDPAPHESSGIAKYSDHSPRFVSQFAPPPVPVAPCTPEYDACFTVLGNRLTYQWLKDGSALPANSAYTTVPDEPWRLKIALDPTICDYRGAQGVYKLRVTAHDTAGGVCGDPVESPTFEIRFCIADFNTDCAVDDFDYFDFLDKFASDDPSADINCDQSIDDFDYFDFLDAFSAGCGS
ncbi:MAG: hypothetical protein JNM07_09985 [Phycisphaerae bacterium]|nr:hypothetical protein [Phycisphaerae bacterium]